MGNNIINNLNLNQLILFVPNTERVSRFAAHMACYIWFSDYQQQPSNNANNNSNSIIDVQSSSNWSLSLEIPPGGSYVNCQRYNEYKPKDPFKKFCLDVLTTTQISFPAILLSLLYIHRMKIRNPKIKGQNGSEYRTFTVALMLANKFLDDNTYTNKTWSEVTRIPVAEINTMEIEFLSALQYKLFVSLDHYNDWLQKITRFINYSDDDSNNNNNNNNNNNQDNISVVNNNNNNNNNNSNNNINNNCGGSSSCGNCKRSAQEAFVDDMTISPPKRTNITTTTTTTTNHNNNSLQYLLPISLSSSSSSSNYNNNNNNNNSNSRSSSNNNNYNYNNYNYNNYARTSSINGMATSAYSYNNPSQPAIEIGSTSYNIPLSNNNYFGNLLLPLTTATVV